EERQPNSATTASSARIESFISCLLHRRIRKKRANVEVVAVVELVTGAPPPVSVAVVPVVDGRALSVVLVCTGCWRQAAAMSARRRRVVRIAKERPGLVENLSSPE